MLKRFFVVAGNYRRFTIAALVASLVLPAACSGGSGHAASFAPPNSGQSAGRQRVTLKIKVPKKSQARVRRHGHFVSPATTQMAIDVQTGCPANCGDVPGYPITASLTPSSDGCTSTLASTYCQLSLTLAPGSYTATLTAQDAQNNALSTAQSIAFVVVAGANNALNVSLSGIPHRIVVAALAQPGYLLETLDADGNVIVGPGAPSFAVASTTGIPVVLTQPSATSPNTFDATTLAAGTASLIVTASFVGGATDACSQPGALCSQNFTLTSTFASTQMFVSNYDSTDVIEYTPSYSGAGTVVQSGLRYPAQIAFNAEGNMFVAQPTNSVVTEFAPPYTGPAIATVGSSGELIGAYGIAFDSHDNLFVSAESVGAVYAYAPPYTGSHIHGFGQGLSEPQSIAFDSSDDLFVADARSNAVLEFAPPYGTPVQLAGLNSPSAVIVDASQNAYIANSGANAIVASSPFPALPSTLVSGLNFPTSLAIHPSGDLYVTNGDAGSILKYAQPYNGAPTTVVSGLNYPAGIAFEPLYTTTIQASP